MYKQAAASRIYLFCICVLRADVWLAVHLLLAIAASDLAPL